MRIWHTDVSLPAGPRYGAVLAARSSELPPVRRMTPWASDFDGHYERYRRHAASAGPRPTIDMVTSRDAPSHSLRADLALEAT